MSFQDITIYRYLPIINGFIGIPPNKPLDNIRVVGDTAPTLLAGSRVVGLSLGS